MSIAISDSSVASLHKADRVGVAASVLCAIHCALAPVLLIFLPTFGKIWAHPLSHALVALLIVPLAAFSIYKGYKIHQKRWVKWVAAVGVFFVLAGAVFPYVGEANGSNSSVPPAEQSPVVVSETEQENTECVSSCETQCTSAENSDCASTCETECTSKEGSACELVAESSCESECSNCEPEVAASSVGENSQSVEPAACVDQCCPSVQVSETGEMSLHIPPAAIITTLGGIFLIAAHVGNLCYCGHACRTKDCCHA